MKKAPIQPPTRNDLLIFQGLQKAIIEKQAIIQVDVRALNKFQSPFFNPWENVIPLLTILFISMFLILVNGIIIGITTLLVFSIFYTFFMPYFLEPFMQNRVMKRVVPRIEKFLIAWRYGGIKLVLTADPTYSCQAPLGDWRAFVETYFLDLIPKDISNDKEH